MDVISNNNYFDNGKTRTYSITQFGTDDRSGILRQVFANQWIGRSGFIQGSPRVSLFQ